VLPPLSPLSFMGIAFVGTFFWPVNPEAAAVLGVTHYGWHPLLVGVIGATGQLVAQTILILSGDQIRRRWGWFDRRCERARQRFGKILARSAPVIGFTSGLLSLPPTSVTAALAPPLHLRVRLLLPVMFVARIIRFTAIAMIAQRVV
jgi:membrane protein YqaA with SNARE-associated domain